MKWELLACRVIRVWGFSHLIPDCLNGISFLIILLLYLVTLFEFLAKQIAPFQFIAQVLLSLAICRQSAITFWCLASRFSCRHQVFSPWPVAVCFLLLEAWLVWCCPTGMWYLPWRSVVYYIMEGFCISRVVLILE